MDITPFQQACTKSISFLEQTFWQLHLWRASSGLVEHIDVFIPSWGMTQKINQIANIIIMDAQTIKIEPWDKSTLASIEKWIYDADLWFTPRNYGDHILISVPPLNQERRKELTKLVSKEWEETKIAIRNHRHDMRKIIETALKNEEISENEQTATEKQIDELTKKYNEMIDQHVKVKSEEIMKI